MSDGLEQLVADIIGLDVSQVSPETSRDTAEQWDSMNHLRLITALEEAFSVHLTMDEIENIRSVADLKEAVDAHL